MNRLTRIWRRSLVLSLTVMGVAALAILALVASAVVGKQIENDAVARAQDSAEVLARATFAPRLPAEGETLEGSALSGLEGQVQAAQSVAPGSKAVLFDGTGRVLYASTGATVAGRPTQADLGTHVVGTGDDKRLRSVLPVKERGGRGVDAYLQFETPYAPVAADIRRRTNRLNIALALGALLLYLLILPTLIRAGRAVRAQYDPRRLQIQHDLKRAIKNNDLSLNFQPIVDSSSHELRAVEALVRWTDPRRGPVPPDAFIPAVEGTPAIWDLSAHIFELAFRQASEWCEEDLRIPIAVNVSGAVLLDKRLIPTIRGLAQKYRIPPRLVELEITEGALVQDPAEASRVLGRIAELGLSVIAIDDFGTGYSSLARLHELPLDTLKVDQSFVKRMARDGDTAIVRSVVDLAHALKMDVIAEGVEDEVIAQVLCEMGAENLQGYFISKPLPAPDLVEWLARESALARAAN